MISAEQFIKRLSDLFAEKRSDVTELCEAFLSGMQTVHGSSLNEQPCTIGPAPDPTLVESRFVRALFGELLIEYDTLTTLLSVRPAPDKPFVMCEKHEYSD